MSLEKSCFVSPRFEKVKNLTKIYVIAIFFPSPNQLFNSKFSQQFDIKKTLAQVAPPLGRLGQASGVR
jgi:hypothetical protein